MNATLTANAHQIPRVANTETGIVCGKCSHWSNGTKIIVRHATVTAVKLCAIGASAPRHGDAPVSAPVRQDVPAGRYAVRDGAGVVRFYVVDHGAEGTKWAGRIFVSVQASDDLHPVRDATRRRAILAAILVDPAGASRLYGQELGRCGVCNRTLTDPESILNGIGRVCASRF